MSMYKILLLTDQQLKCDSSSVGDIEIIEREYAALTEEDTSKYNELVQGMFKTKYSNTAHDRSKAAEGAVVDFTKDSDKGGNLQTSSSKSTEISLVLKFSMAAIFLVIGYWSIQLIVQEGLTFSLIDKMMTLLSFSFLFLLVLSLCMTAIYILSLLLGFD